MALEDIEEQMEKLDGAEKRKPGKLSIETRPREVESEGVSWFATVKKIAVWAAMFVVVGMLAYFLLKPYGGKGTSPTVYAKTHEFGEQTLNLHDGRTGLRVNIVVEVNDPRCINKVTLNDSMLRDMTIEILSRKTIEDINSVAKRNRLKRELLDDFNLELNLENGRLMKVYFREFFYFNLEGLADN